MAVPSTSSSRHVLVVVAAVVLVAAVAAVLVLVGVACWENSMTLTKPSTKLTFAFLCAPDSWGCLTSFDA